MQEYQSATKSCRSSFHHSDHKPGLDDDDDNYEVEDHVIVVVVRMGMRTPMVKMVMVMIITML